MSSFRLPRSLLSLNEAAICNPDVAIYQSIEWTFESQWTLFAAKEASKDLEADRGLCGVLANEGFMNKHVGATHQSGSFNP